MATKLLGSWLPNNLYATLRHGVGFGGERFTMQTREYAARKGTRARRDAMKVKRKIEKVEKIGFLEKLAQEKKESGKMIVRPKGRPDSSKPIPTDDVWMRILHQQKVYTFEEAILCHREVFHPTILNDPSPFVQLKIDLNLETEKKGKSKSPSVHSGLVHVPHNFPHEEIRKIAAFVTSSAKGDEARQAGATLVGGKDLIKSIKAGDISLNDYEFYLAHPDVLADLILIRGLLKKKFPTTRTGTLSEDLGDMVKKFMEGVKYNTVVNKLEKHRGQIECPIGKLDMEIEHLEANFAAIIKDISSKSRKQANMIQRTLLMCPPSGEIFKVDFLRYLPEEETKKISNVEEEDEEDISHAVISSQ